MRYVSIDIETTGVALERCQVLEIGAVIEDSNNPLPLDELPVFQAFLHHEALHWEDVAKGMHVSSGLYREYMETPQKVQQVAIAKLFAQFLSLNGFPLDDKNRVVLVVAGKNFTTFDRVFLEKLPDWRTHIKIIQRVLDPTLHYVDFANDEEPPSMKVCKERAGIIDTKVAHRAVDDALDVIRLLRPVYTWK